MKFKPLQAIVAQHYEGGEFSHIADEDHMDECGDTLFKFCILEAGDASDAEEFHRMLETAINQLRSLQGEIT